MQLQEKIDEFKQAEIQIVGISYDDVGILKKFSERRELSFPLLSDKGSKTIKALGLEDKQGLPHSGTLLIDKEYKVRAKIFYDGYRKRHSTNELLEAAKLLPQ